MPYILSHALFIDDLNRSINGFDWSQDVRYLDNWLFNLLTLKNIIPNIHPLPTVLACLLGAVGSLLLIRILTNNKITMPAILVSSFLIMTPVTFAIMSFQYDCIGMVFAILSSILPYVFWQEFMRGKVDKWRYLWVGLFVIICTLATYLTYASATGVFAIIGLWMVASALIFNTDFRKSFMEIIKPATPI